MESADESCSIKVQLLRERAENVLEMSARLSFLQDRVLFLPVQVPEDPSRGEHKYPNGELYALVLEQVTQ